MFLLALTTTLTHAAPALHAGAQLGATWGRSGLGPGPAVRLHAGVSLGTEHLIILPQVALGVSQASASGVVTDTGDSTWTWETQARSARAGAGLTLRILDTSPKLHPEISAQGELHLVATTSSLSRSSSS